MKPTIVATSYSISYFAEELGKQDFKIVYPVPTGTHPFDWNPSPERIAELKLELETAGTTALFLVPEKATPAKWIAAVKGKSNSTVSLPHPQAGLSPLQTFGLLNETATALSNFAPQHSEAIEERRESLLSKRLDPLINRWRTAANAIPKNRQLLGLGKRLLPIKQGIPNITTTFVEPNEILDKAAQRKAAQLVTAEPLTSDLEGKFDAAGITIYELNPAFIASTDSDFFSILGENVSTIETLSQDLIAQIPALTDNYEHGVFPLLERYCIECHDTETEEGGVNFELFLTEADAVKNPDFWDHVTAQVDIGAMPPRKEELQPTPEERERLLGWIAKLSARWDAGEFGKDPSRTTLRRLNKNEFNYTIRDLFGIQIRPADGFPEDAGGAAGFDNNADALFLPSLLMENYVDAASAIAQSIFANRTTRDRFLFAKPGGKVTELAAARTVLSRWASLAFRRVATESEVNRLVDVYKNARKTKKSYAEAMQMPLVGLLISPNFLYRAEAELPNTEPYPIDNFALASRLSYFLWSSMPDKELLGLAHRGELNNDAALEAQVIRMLGDKRSASLGMHFGGQWFGWELLRSRANPDEERYPEFNFPLRIAMYQESTLFFQNLITDNASIYDLIDCNYTFLNDRLAAHYQIPNVSGSEMRKVVLNDRNRGGVIGMGSVLVSTSLPLRSSPAVRGDYVLGEILGTPPPEPPMNVEQLPEDDRQITTHSFREELEQHRNDPNCKSCHETIDPIGFGLENFDAIGRWRTEQNGHPIDATGEMPDGTAITSPADIKKLLLADKELFARNLSEKLLSYALGRELTPYDRPVVASITKKIIENDGRIHTAFIEVAKSYPFRNRRNDGYQAK